MADKEELGVRLKKLLVRLNLQEGKQLGTMVQIIQDLLFLSHTDHCGELWALKEKLCSLCFVNISDACLNIFIDSYANVQNGPPSVCLSQWDICWDIFRFVFFFCPAVELFSDQNVHMPLMLVLSSHFNCKVQQVVSRFCHSTFFILWKGKEIFRRMSMLFVSI